MAASTVEPHVVSSSGAPLPASAQQHQRARFRVKFSDVLLSFSSAVPSQNQASLTFSFDSFWTGETTATGGARSKPTASGSNSEAEYALSFRSYSNNAGKTKTLDAPEAEPRFMYETSLASKLHRKFLVLTLNMGASSHSPTAIISIDSLARGCQRIALTFSDPANTSGPALATAHFRVSMLHFERVQAILSDVKVADYPEKYMHDVKMMFIEMGARPSPEGPINPTEKSSDSEPRFSKLPTLEKVCSLQEMLHGGAAPSDLRIFFQLHRQVARTRTEQIGLGALPVHMLFSKVVSGRMEEPTKFKVPLAGYKGVVKGKIMLRNIPQWSQLGGDDLVNRDGTITPSGVDLNSRKLLPWMKLPRSVSSTRRPNAPSPSVRAYASPMMQPSGASMQHQPQHQHQHMHMRPHPSMVAPGGGYKPGIPSLPPSLQSTPDISAPLPPPDICGPPMAPAHMQQLPPSAKWPEGSIALPPSAHFGSPAVRVNGHHRKPSADYFADVAAVTATGSVVAPSLDTPTNVAAPSATTGETTAGSPPEHVIGPSGTGGGTGTGSEGESVEREQDLQRDYQRQREEYQRSTYYALDHVAQAPPSAMYLPYVNLEQDPGAPVDSHVVVGGSKSSKSFGSSTTGYEGGNSDLQVGSDDGHVPAPQSPMVEEWTAIPSANPEVFYFANSLTGESLWLPPGWERRLDGDGRPFFVDHENQQTQREFPAEEARRYKEMVESGGAAG